MEVEISIKVDESKVAAYQKLAEDLGDEISITKPIKFEDLGLSPMENGQFQCLACSKILSRKQTAVHHYKKLHISSTNQVDYKIQCPRCSQEIAKSALNSHMNQKHGIENFRQFYKRSFLPDASENPAKREKVPKTAFENDMVLVPKLDQNYYNNIKLEQSDDQEVSEDLNIKQEQQE